MPDIDLNDDKAGGTPPVAFTPDQFSSLIEAIRGNQTDRVEVEAEIHARALKKQMSPQNDTCPQISPFNPLGDRNHPRPRLKCAFFLGPYPLEPETLSVKELTLMNKLEPGQYEVTKADGQMVIFIVIPRYHMDGRTLDKITIGFPCADSEQRQNYPPFGQMLREVVDQIEVKQLTAPA